MSDTVPSSKNGLAISGLVLGIIGVCLCWVPFVNNVAVILGIIGLILSIFAVVKSKKLHAGKGMSIAAIVLNALAIVATLAIQQAMVAAIDDAMNGGDAAKQVAAVSAPASSGEAKSDAAQSDNKDQDLKLGEAATFKNGAKITVTAVEKGLTASYANKTFSRVEITIENTGKDSISINPFYWKSENPQGVQAGYGYFPDAVNEMKAGDLAAGGKTTANIYFEDDCVKVLYTPGLSNAPTATWVVS